MSAEIFEKDRPFDPEHHPAVQVPDGVDRRAFMMRTAAVGAAALIAGRPVPTLEAAQSPASAPPPLSPDLEVVKKARLPVMTTLVEFYKVGPSARQGDRDQGPPRCAFGAVKSWTGFMIASNEIHANRRVDFDTTVAAMALTAREMNAKYKETSEGGLAVSVTLC
jgi:hypothetical protein